MAAPKGNKNALKHGFYSKHLSRDEIATINKTDTTDLSGEIFLLRVIAGRLFKRLKTLSELSEQELKEVNTLTLITTAISTLARTQSIMGGLLPDTEEAFLEALNKVREGKGIS